MTPDTAIPGDIRQMLAHARPDQIARLLRDIKSGPGPQAGFEARKETRHEVRQDA